MSKTIRLPWPIANLSFRGGLTIRLPLPAPEVFALGESAQWLVDHFDDTIDEFRMQSGLYSSLLPYLHQGEVEKVAFTVPFRPAKDGALFPELSLKFEALRTPVPDEGHIAFIPALGAHAFAETLEDLEESLIDAVRLDFLRKGRLTSVHGLLATQWFEGVEVRLLHTHTRAYTPAELRGFKKVKELLRTVAGPRSERSFRPTFGLEEELGAFMRAVEGKFHESVLLIGPSGVGKTALVDAFCREKDAHPDLGSREVWETNASRLLRGLMDPGGWQQNLARVCEELRDGGGFLFVQKLADLFNVGQFMGNRVSMAEFLRGPLERGEIRIIAECTDEEAAILEARHPGYLKAFRQIRLEEPTGSRLRDIVGRRARWVAGAVAVSDEAIDAAITLHQRYTPYSGFPGKPIRFLERLTEGAAAAEQEAAPSWAWDRKTGMDSEVPSVGIEVEPSVTASLVVAAFCEESGMPAFLVDPDAPLPPTAIEEHFRSRIFGQNAGVTAVVDAVASVKSALGRGGRPMASLLFAGPTGVGKTETAKALAELLFGRRDRLLRFDMSEYAEVEAVLRLTGESGPSQDGVLTGAVRQNPFSVVLFDEIEKANPVFEDLLLQVLDAGRLTDGRGRVADFCSTVIIMTSNVGAESLSRGSLGLGSRDGESAAVLAHFARAVEAHFRPELYNRFDRVVCFAPLDPASIRSVVDREVRGLWKWPGLRDRDVTLTVREEAYHYLALVGYDQEYGARQVQRAVRDHLVSPLARALSAEPRYKSLDVVVEKGEGSLEIEVRHRGYGKAEVPEPGLLGILEGLTEWRRFFHALEDGPDYLWLRARMALLSQENELAPSSFRSREMGKKAGDLAVLRREVDALMSLFQRSGDLEGEWMGQLLTEAESSGGSTDPGAAAATAKFREVLDALRRDAWPHMEWLFDFDHEKLRTAVLGLYGQLPRALRALSKQYREAAQAEGLSVRTRDVCLLPDQGDGRRTLGVCDAGEWETKEGTLLVGVEMEISGPAAGLLLEGEDGLYAWATERGREKVVIRVAAGQDFESFQRPDGVHRKHFFQGGKFVRKYQEKKGQVYFDEEAPFRSFLLDDLGLLLKRRRMASIIRHLSRGRASLNTLFSNLPFTPFA